ncbi:hypothetical protein Pcinc_013816 [Petrolisthes cinctipes]|uniref:Uncharacterized protein n=1 Tax=Petrolisthes cinctipes TaxID=88211 RepID=A0AAE1FXY0_PETCI|nr:hypothetical protein Pcinc_013816 [Petrolisthes cinctipes]
MAWNGKRKDLKWKERGPGMERKSGWTWCWKREGLAGRGAGKEREGLAGRGAGKEKEWLALVLEKRKSGWTWCWKREGLGEAERRGLFRETKI